MIDIGHDVDYTYTDVKFQSKKEKNMRKTYLDNIRWITVVIVVIYHVIYMFNGVTKYGIIGPFSSFQPQDAFQYVVYPWFMLLLFTVSGMSARFELSRKTEKEFLRSRTIKLLVPSTIGLLVFGWILGYYNMAISGAFNDLNAVPKVILFLIMAVSGVGPLWYIQMLWIFSVLLLFLRKIEKDRLYGICVKANVPVLLALTIVIYGAARILNTPIIVVYRFGIYGAGFLIGYFVLSHDEVMEKVGRCWLLLSILGVICCIAFLVIFWGQIYSNHEVLDTLMCNVYAWLGTLGVLGFMKKWGGSSNSFSTWMCKKSWGLYVFHYLFIAVAAWYLHLYAPSMPAVLVYLLVGVSAFAGSLVLYEIMSRIPVLRWCVLGMSGKGKKN